MNTKSRIATGGNPGRPTLLTGLLDEIGREGAGKVARQATAATPRSRGAAVVSERSNTGTNRGRGTTILTASLEKNRHGNLRRAETRAGGSSDGGRTSRTRFNVSDRETPQGTGQQPRSSEHRCLDIELTARAVRSQINEVVDSMRPMEEELFKLKEKVKVVEKELAKVNLGLSLAPSLKIPRKILKSPNPVLTGMDVILSVAEAANLGGLMAKKQQLERELQSYRQSIAANEKALENLKRRRDRLEMSRTNIGKLITSCKEKHS